MEWMCPACDTSNYMTRMTCRSRTCLTHKFVMSQKQELTNARVLRELAPDVKCQRCCRGGKRVPPAAECPWCGCGDEEWDETALHAIASMLHAKNPKPAMFVAKKVVRMCFFSYEVAQSVCEVALVRRESVMHALSDFCNEMQSMEADGWDVCERHTAWLAATKRWRQTGLSLTAPSLPPAVRRAPDIEVDRRAEEEDLYWMLTYLSASKRVCNI